MAPLSNQIGIYKSTSSTSSIHLNTAPIIVKHLPWCYMMHSEETSKKKLLHHPCNPALGNDRGGREISVAAAAEFFPEKERRRKRALFTDSYPSTYLSNYTTHSCRPTLPSSLTVSPTQECQAVVHIDVSKGNGRHLGQSTRTLPKSALSRFLVMRFTQRL